MSETSIPGQEAKHAIVGPECRETWGDRGAGKVAVARLLDEYLDCVKAHRGTKTQFHFVLTVERPA